MSVSDPKQTSGKKDYSGDRSNPEDWLASGLVSMNRATLAPTGTW